MLQTHTLKYFADVARHGSLRMAADLQEIAPSALSRQITQLEKFLDAKLFERTAKGMQLTEVGRELYLFVEENNRSVDALLQRIEDIDELRHGVVRISTIEGATTSLLPDALAKFSASFPGIKFEVIVCGSNDVAQRVGRGESEIGLAFNCPSKDDVILQARISQPLNLVARPDHPVLQGGATTFSNLKGLQFALPNLRFGIRRLIDQTLRASKTDISVAFESDSLQLIKQFVSQTDMVTCLPKIVFERELLNGSLAASQLKDPLCSSASVDIITQQSRAPSGAARKFLAMLLEIANTKYV
jgi:DNA-binding transcriptional LysR family regulator